MAPDRDAPLRCGAQRGRKATAAFAQGGQYRLSQTVKQEAEKASTWRVFPSSTSVKVERKAHEGWVRSEMSTMEWTLMNPDSVEAV